MEVKPYKFPPVRFEARFDRHNDDIFYKLIDIGATKKAINSIHILPNWAEAINEKVVSELMVKSIHGTLAIEGNPSTEKEVKETLAQSVDIKKVKERKVQERYNMKKAYEFIKKIGKKPEDKSRIRLSEKLIKKLQEIITFNTHENDNMPGYYRNAPVEVGLPQYGGIYRPPKILDDIKMLMAGFVEWLNSEEILKEYPVFRAILSHYYLELIHPFADGNGRVGRAIESLILSNSGFKYGTSFGLWRYYYENYGEYFILLSKTRKGKEGDQTEFVIFVLKLLQKALNVTHKSIIRMIDNLLYKDYVSFLLKEEKISQRQYAIVNFILEVTKPMTKKELSEHPVIQEIYKGFESKARLFQLDMQNIISNWKLLKKIKKENTEICVANYNLITRAE